jgi:hypothetical protein
MQNQLMAFVRQFEGSLFSDAIGGTGDEYFEHRLKYNV